MENPSEAIKNGLIQYIGAILSNCERQGSEAAHVALAQLSEAWLVCCQKEDGSYNLFAAKPILRAANILLEQRLDSIKEHLRMIDEEPDNSGIVNEYETAVRVLRYLINVSKTEENRW